MPLVITYDDNGNRVCINLDSAACRAISSTSGTRYDASGPFGLESMAGHVPTVQERDSALDMNALEMYRTVVK